MAALLAVFILASSVEALEQEEAKAVSQVGQVVDLVEAAEVVEFVGLTRLVELAVAVVAVLVAAELDVVLVAGLEVEVEEVGSKVVADDSEQVVPAGIHVVLVDIPDPVAFYFLALVLYVLVAVVLYILVEAFGY